MQRIKGMQIYVDRVRAVYRFVARYPDGRVLVSEFMFGHATTKDAVAWFRSGKYVA